MKKRLIILLTFICVVGIAFLGDIHAQGIDITPLPGLFVDVKRLTDEPTNDGRCEALIAMLSEKDIPFEVETFSYTSRRNSEAGDGKNLVVTLGSGERDIVIGAHYDKVSVGSGVVDNGCSSIILIRLAEALKNEELNHRIRIIFFDKEEIGLVGSAHFLEAHADDPIVSMINLDVNAYGNTIMMGATALNRLYRIAKTVCVENDVEFIVFPRFGGSDDVTFRRAGVETAMFSIAPAVEAHQFWLAMNGGEELRLEGIPQIMSNMHSENDTIDKMQPEAMTITYTVVLETVKRLDKIDK